MEVKSERRSLKDCIYQSPEICMEAVVQDDMDLEHVEDELKTE